MASSGPGTATRTSPCGDGREAMVPPVVRTLAPIRRPSPPALGRTRRSPGWRGSLPPPALARQAPSAASQTVGTYTPSAVDQNTDRSEDFVCTKRL
jgi:hypothetical protein